MEMPKSTMNQLVKKPSLGYFTPTCFVTNSVTATCIRHNSDWYIIWATI